MKNGFNMFPALLQRAVEEEEEWLHGGRRAVVSQAVLGVWGTESRATPGSVPRNREVSLPASFLSY